MKKEKVRVIYRDINPEDEEIEEIQRIGTLEKTDEEVSLEFLLSPKNTMEIFIVDNGRRVKFVRNGFIQYEISHETGKVSSEKIKILDEFIEVVVKTKVINFGRSDVQNKYELLVEFLIDGEMRRVEVEMEGK